MKQHFSQPVRCDRIGFFNLKIRSTFSLTLVPVVWVPVVFALIPLVTIAAAQQPGQQSGHQPSQRPDQRVQPPAQSLAGQDLRLNELPGYDSYLKAKRARKAAAYRGRVEDVRWAVDGSGVIFTANKRRQQFNLLTGRLERAKKIAAGPSLKQQEANSSDSRPVPRAQQRRAQRSPDGSLTAIYKDFNVWIRNQKNLKLRPVTTAGTDRLRYGTGCWVYGEELEQDTAMWWSPDGSKLAFYETDEREMRDYVLTTDNTKRYTSTHTVRYPKAGDANPVVGLMVYDVATGQTKRLQVKDNDDQYIFNVRFSPDGDELIFNRSNRRQDRLDIMAVNVTTAMQRIIVTETQPTFQNFKPTMRFLKDGQRFVWETERSGWKNFELRNLKGDRLASLSEFSNFPCDEIVLIDEGAGLMYYTAFSDANPYNRQLHRCRLDGTSQTRITTASLNHSSFLISPDHRYVIALGQRFDAPARTLIYAIDDGSSHRLPADFRQGIVLTPKGDPIPADENNEIFSFIADDGVTEIYGTLQKPTDFDPAKRYPLLIDVYGGPLSEGISNRFAATDPICEFGFLKATIGNRGTINRGKRFEAATYKYLGGVDLDDQAAGVRHLAQRRYVDSSRVGIFGHSYGGYLTAMGVLKYPQIFHVGVAGAPVTDWRNYDTIYTERYMRLPAENVDGYRDSSCLTYADRCEGKLLLVHGLVDDNVHPANTWQLVERLQRNDQRFDLMIYPRFKHGIGSNYQRLRLEYLIRHLKK